MEREQGIRLGSIQAKYDPRKGLILKDVHNPLNVLTVCDSDLADLMVFVCRSSRVARQAAASNSQPDTDESAG